MATLAATELADGSVPVSLVNFGSPRVGDKAYAAWAQMRLNQTTPIRMRRQKDIVPAVPPRSVGYVHIGTEVYDKHLDSKGHQTANDTFVVCDGSGEDPHCGDAEEHPPFPLDLVHMEPAEHTRYLSFQGGDCWCGAAGDAKANCK
eukprot:g2800.t1